MPWPALFFLAAAPPHRRMSRQKTVTAKRPRGKGGPAPVQRVSQKAATKIDDALAKQALADTTEEQVKFVTRLMRDNPQFSMSMFGAAQQTVTIKK